MNARTNAQAWESEYRNPQFLSLGTEPLSDVREFMRWLRRKQKVDASEFTVLDLGCGNGKNLRYVVDEFARSGIGYDISKSAISEAEKLRESLDILYEVRSIGEAFPLKAETVDLALDVTSSNSLSEKERDIFLNEVSRVLRPGSYFFVRALCKDGDDNAKKLIKDSPGLEHDTYVLPEVGVTERVFSKADFESTYKPHFDIVMLEKTSGYQRWGTRSFRRNYWVAYLRKPSV